MMLRTPLPGGRRLLILETLTVCLLVLMALAFARPLAEEWTFIKFFNEYGLAGVPELARAHYLRPLMPLPFALEWVLGHGRPFGFALGCALMIVTKYLVARWAVTPVLHRSERWVFATLASVLVPWPAAWQLRYSETHPSLVFLLVALGAVLRLSEKFSLVWTLVGAAAIALMAATYQALLLCALAIPFIALCSPPARRDLTFGKWAAGRLARTGAPVVLGCALYAAYAVVVSTRTETLAYEARIFQSGAVLRSWSGITSAVADLYRTAFVDSGFVLPLMLAVLSLAAAPRLLIVRTEMERYRDAALLFAGLMLLPLLAAPYSFDVFRRVDPDRVLFPVSAGFALLTLVALRKHTDPSVEHAPGHLWALALVTPVLLTTAIDASGWHRHYVIEDQVLSQTTRLAVEHGARSVVLRDSTGTLGDIFAYEIVFRDALAARGLPIQAVICTPLGVDRIGSIVRRLGTFTSTRCEDLPTPSGVLFLDATTSPNGDWTIVSPAAAGSATPGRGFSVRESAESQVWWWMTAPAGAIRVTGEPSSTVVVFMTLSPPPCGPVQASIDGKPFRVTEPSPVEVPVSINAAGSGAIAVVVTDKPCTPQGTSRDLFVAVYNPATRQCTSASSCDQESTTPVVSFDLPDTGPIGSGWRVTEPDRAGGTFRWSLTESATVSVNLANYTDLVLEFRVAMWLESDVVDSLTLSVNGTAIPLTYGRAQPSGRLYRGVLPRAVLARSSGRTDLVFHVRRLAPVPTAPDVKLGIALGSLRIRPR